MILRHRVVQFIRDFLNERRFHQGSEVRPVPLLSLVGASNEPKADWGRQAERSASLRLFADGGWAKMAAAARRRARGWPAAAATTAGHAERSSTSAAWASPRRRGPSRPWPI